LLLIGVHKVGNSLAAQLLVFLKKSVLYLFSKPQGLLISHSLINLGYINTGNVNRLFKLFKDCSSHYNVIELRISSPQP
jgi:hypothetical protein